MTTDDLKVEVECYAGYRAEQEPRRFKLGKREIEVAEVIDRWLDPEHHYFKVRGDDGAIYILRYDSKIDEWEMRLFDSGKSEETQLSST
jgi:hypothetical protein